MTDKEKATMMSLLVSLLELLNGNKQPGDKEINSIIQDAKYKIRWLKS